MLNVYSPVIPLIFMSLMESLLHVNYFNEAGKQPLLSKKLKLSEIFSCCSCPIYSKSKKGIIVLSINTILAEHGKKLSYSLHLNAFDATNTLNFVHNFRLITPTEVFSRYNSSSDVGIILVSKSNLKQFVALIYTI